MANKIGTSLKHVQIDKANTAMIVAVSIATFIFVFSGFLGSRLLQQRSYQGKVIAVKEQARDQMNENITAAESLNDQYQAFVTKDPNLIGGSIQGEGDMNGDNARLILDSLPSRYDFPALATSLEKILTTGDDNQISITSIRGVDEELIQQGLTPQDISAAREAEAAATAVAQGPIEMPFGISVEGSYEDLQNLIGLFERSIRPFNVRDLVIAGGQGNLSLELNAQTYYQPARIFEIEYETVER